jgi:hypothetical protein
VSFVSHHCFSSRWLCVSRRRVPYVVYHFKTARPIPVKFSRPLDPFRVQVRAKFGADPPSGSISSVSVLSDVDQDCYTGFRQSSAKLSRPHVLREPRQRSAPNCADASSPSLPRRPPNLKSIGRTVLKRQSTHGTQGYAGDCRSAVRVRPSATADERHVRFRRNLAAMRGLLRYVSVANFMRI